MGLLLIRVTVLALALIGQAAAVTGPEEDAHMVEFSKVLANETVKHHRTISLFADADRTILSGGGMSSCEAVGFSILGVVTATLGLLLLKRLVGIDLSDEKECVAEPSETARLLSAENGEKAEGQVEKSEGGGGDC